MVLMTYSTRNYVVFFVNHMWLQLEVIYGVLLHFLLRMLEQFLHTNAGTSHSLKEFSTITVQILHRDTK